MAPISDFIDPVAIALDQQVSDWEEAIRSSGHLLEATGVAEPAYTQAMVESVHEHGPYIVVAPGFAFAHARPSEAVLRTGMSWVRLADPIEFGHSSNDPVTLVVALAAKDSSTHQEAMASLARLLGDKETRAALDEAGSPEEVYALLGGSDGTATADGAAQKPAQPAARAKAGQHRILTVCGNGLGTSLFLKNTLEKVLVGWGWSRFVIVEATDTVSARGKAKDVDLIFTSGEIARTLGDVGVPMKVIENFTSTIEIDQALRESYDI
ncbi:MAG TPA: PTS sugar transporter subunit IIA [Acidimicrobiia bacterium]